jgi:hypothetical protein
MSKKVNTVWFILGATVFNVRVTVVCMLVLGGIVFRLILPRLANPGSIVMVALPVVFLGSVVLSFLIYRTALNFLMKKINFENYFDPLWGPRPKRKE